MRQGLHAVEVGRPGAAGGAAVHDGGDAVGHGGRGDDAARRGHVVEDVISCSVFPVVTASAARTAATGGRFNWINFFPQFYPKNRCKISD